MKFDETRFLAETHHFDSFLMTFSFSVVPPYFDLNPFDTIGVSVTPSPLTRIWAQGTSKNHIEPRNEVLER